MAVDPEKAIEKLSKYRQESKQNKKADSPTSETRSSEPSEIRQFFLKYYKFNVVIAMTLGFALLISGFKTLPPGIFWFTVASVAFFSSIVSFRTISRLEESDGRKTTIDDMFGIFILMLLFFGYVPYFPLDQTIFTTIHIILVIIWFLQIYFVNYRKPDFANIKRSKGGIVEKESRKISSMERIKLYFTKDRLMLTGISLVLGIAISIPQLL